MKNSFTTVSVDKGSKIEPAHVAGSSIPQWLGATWAGLCIVGLPFAGRIAWEKTFLTWSRGPQMAGFSMLHIHPVFSIVGMLACMLLMVWLLPALIYVFLRRRDLAWPDIAMLLIAGLITIAIVIPDDFFAARK